MPRFVAQTLSQDGNVIASNFEISINFTQQGVLKYWSGNFTLPATSRFNPNTINPTTIFKVQLDDGRAGEINITRFSQSQTTGNWNIEFNNRGELE